MSLERYLDVFKCARFGLTSPFPSDLQERLADRLRSRECLSFNPNPENILDEIASVIDHRKCSFSRLKSDFGIARADFLIYYMSFADHHNLEEVEKFSVFSDGALKVINAIKNEFNKTNLSVGIGRQLELALDVSEDNLTLAILYLALGTRAIARGLDHRLFKDAQQKTKNKIPESFRNVVRAFGYGEEGEDPQGDTYHFWHGVVAGLSREEEADPFLIREIKGRCLDWIYTNSANTVSFFRDRLILKRKLDNHRTVDLLGYSVGRAIAHSNSLS